MVQQDTMWPKPPKLGRAALRLATLDVPFQTAFPAEGEATGLLVKVRVSGPARATFALRHAYISSDLGLPAAGVPLEGGIHVQDGRARVAVYTSAVSFAFTGLIVAAMVLLGLSSIVQEPWPWNVAWLVALLAMLNWSYRRAKAALPRVVSDAVQALERLSTSGRTDPWR